MFRAIGKLRKDALGNLATMPISKRNHDCRDWLIVRYRMSIPPIGIRGNGGPSLAPELGPFLWLTKIWRGGQF
jgi:hypothetical protein